MPIQHEQITVVPDNNNFFPVAQNWPLIFPAQTSHTTAMIYFFCLAKFKLEKEEGHEETRITDSYISVAFNLGLSSAGNHKRALVRLGLLTETRRERYTVKDWPDYVAERRDDADAAALIAESDRQHIQRRVAVLSNIAERNANARAQIGQHNRDSHDPFGDTSDPDNPPF